LFEEIEMNLNQRLRRLETTFVDDPIVLFFNNGSTRRIHYSGHRILGLYMAAVSGETEPGSPTRQHLEWIRDSNGSFDPAGGEMINLIRIVLAAGAHRFQRTPDCVRPAILGPLPSRAPQEAGGRAGESDK
jgi:hypothetical protein